MCACVVHASCMCVCIGVHVCVCMCVDIICVHVCVCAYYMCACVCVCVCVYCACVGRVTSDTYQPEVLRNYPMATLLRPVLRPFPREGLRMRLSMYSSDHTVIPCL